MLLLSAATRRSSALQPPSSLRVGALLARMTRPLSSAAPSSGGGGRGGRRPDTPPWERSRQPLPAIEQKLNRDFDEMWGAMQERLDASSEPRLRAPPPLPPTYVSETWAPASLVSSLPNENALTFRTRFYIDSTGQQQFHSVKVQLTVRIQQLGLSKVEEARLVSVARPHYRKKGHQLLLSCSRYLEVPRNKAHLRETVAKLLADTRANAAAHAASPDAERPLAARRQPWLPGDYSNVYRKRPPTYHKIMHKSPG